MDRGQCQPFARHIRTPYNGGMATLDVKGPLSAGEFESLRELSKGLRWQTIPFQHTAKLLRLGYATEAIGGLRITESGQVRVAKGS